MLIIIVQTSYSNDLTISLKIKKLIFAKIRPGKSSVPLLAILKTPYKRTFFEIGHLPLRRRDIFHSTLLIEFFMYLIMNGRNDKRISHIISNCFCCQTSNYSRGGVRVEPEGDNIKLFSSHIESLCFGAPLFTRVRSSYARLEKQLC